MITLHVLGRLELSGSDGQRLRSVQPKRQAVLLYLAIAVPRGYHRRDTLVGLLWPERDEEHARGSLTKAVSDLRRTLGGDALLNRGRADLGLDERHLWCDATAFEDALDRGALTEAMALYRGELLPGFHVDEAPEFDQWLERERARLRGRAVQAAKFLSEREETACRFAAAIEWARQACAIDSFDEAAVRRVMAALDRAGDRGGALRAYEGFAERVRLELDAEPAAETTALMAAIRDRHATPAVVPSSLIAPLAPPLEAPAEPLVETPTDTEARPRPHAARRARRTSLAWAIAGAAGIIVLTGWAILGAGRVSGTDGARAPVAMFPFVVGDGVPAGVSDSLAAAIARGLDGDGSLRLLHDDAIPSISASVAPDFAGATRARLAARRAGARFVLLGNVDVSADSLRVATALFDTLADTEAVARAMARGRRDQLDSLTGEIVWQLLAMHPAENVPRYRPRVAEITPSLVALRAFLAGQQELRDGRFADATKEFKTAVDADTLFALAYANLSRSANWTGDYAMSEFAAERAARYIDRLTALDQAHVRAMRAYQSGRPIEAERWTRLILSNDVGVADAWSELGELRFHWGPILGWTLSEAREAFEQTLAINADAGTIVHLARLAAAQGRTAAVDSLAQRALSMGVDEPQALELRALRASVMNDRAEASRVEAAIARLDDDTACSIVTMVAVYGAEYASTRGITDAVHSPRRSARCRTIGGILSAELAAAHGQTSAAEQALSASAGLPPARAMEYRAMLATLPFRATTAANALRLRDSLSAFRDEGLIGPGPEQYAVDAIYPPRRRYLLAMLSLEAGDTTAAMRYVDELERPIENEADRAYQRAAARLIRAEVLRARGQASQALALLGKPSELPGHVLPSVLDYPSAHERYLRAELLRETGKPYDALRWYDTFPDPGGYDLMYLPAVHLAVAELLEQTGNPAAARASYQRGASLLSAAAPDWSPALRARETRLAAELGFGNTGSR